MLSVARQNGTLLMHACGVLLDPNSDTVLRWRCPSCELEWYDRGRGFHGTRFSTCLRCGTDACEPYDSRPALAARDPQAAFLISAGADSGI
jgi:hypothetical protein